MIFRIQGIQRRGDGKDCAPLPPKEGEAWDCRWREQAGGAGWSVQPKGPVHCHWSILISCKVVDGQTRASYIPSAPPPVVFCSNWLLVPSGEQQEDTRLAMADRAAGDAGAARRRRERRLSIAMALAEALHHSTTKLDRRRRKWWRGARAVRRWRTRRTTLHAQRPTGTPQERVQRHTMEQVAEFALVQILDAPVLQTVEQLADILKLMDTQSPVEQVIDVPKIILDLVSQRSSLRAPQLAEQLVCVCRCPPSPRVPAPAEILEEFLALGRGATGRTGSTSVHHVGLAGGCWARGTSSGAHGRGSSPAQGGVQILGAVPHGRIVDKVDDVPVNMLYKFQQSLPSDSDCASVSVRRQSGGHSSCGLAVSCSTPCFVRGVFFVDFSGRWLLCILHLLVRQWIHVMSVYRGSGISSKCRACVVFSLSVAVLLDFSWLVSSRTSSWRRSWMPRSFSRCITDIRQPKHLNALTFVARWSMSLLRDVQVSQMQILEVSVEIPQLQLVEKLVVAGGFYGPVHPDLESLGSSLTRLLTCPSACRHVELRSLRSSSSWTL